MYHTLAACAAERRAGSAPASRVRGIIHAGCADHRRRSFPIDSAACCGPRTPTPGFQACLAAMEGGVGTIEITKTVPFVLRDDPGPDRHHRRPVPRSGSGRCGTRRSPRGQGRRAPTSWSPRCCCPRWPKPAAQEDILCVLGALTPTEIYQARVAGAALVKVFPDRTRRRPRVHPGAERTRWAACRSGCRAASDRGHRRLPTAGREGRRADGIAVLRPRRWLTATSTRFGAKAHRAAEAAARAIG